MMVGNVDFFVSTTHAADTGFADSSGATRARIAGLFLIPQSIPC
jgi:hypothetical protein